MRADALRTAQFDHSTRVRPTVSALVELAGGALVIAGSLLPWLTLYAGNVELLGIEGLLGQLLAAIGLAAVSFTAVALLLGRELGWSGRVLRATLAVGALALSGYLAVQLVLTVRQLSAEPLLLAGYGPGVVIATSGGVMLVLARALPTTFTARIRAPSRLVLARAAAAGGLLVAGAIHLALAPGHFTLLPLLGMGFLLVGIGQAAIATALVAVRHRRVVLAAALAAAIPLLLYVFDVTAGLPFVGHEAAHAAAGTHGHPTGEAHGAPGLDPVALLTKTGELIALIGAYVLYPRREREMAAAADTTGHSAAAW